MFLDTQLEFKTILFVIIDTLLVFLITLFWFKFIDKPPQNIPDECKEYIQKDVYKKSVGLTILYTVIFLIYYYIYDFIFKYKHL
jgi:hypothetical protein